MASNAEPEDTEPLRPPAHEWSKLPEVHYTQQEANVLPEAVPVSNYPEADLDSDNPDQGTTYYHASRAELATTSLPTDSPRPAVRWLRRGGNKVILGVASAVVLSFVAMVVGIVVWQRDG